jgi:hypothetical protein
MLLISLTCGSEEGGLNPNVALPVILVNHTSFKSFPYHGLSNRRMWFELFDQMVMQHISSQLQKGYSPYLFHLMRIEMTRLTFQRTTSGLVKIFFI